MSVERIKADDPKRDERIQEIFLQIFYSAETPFIARQIFINRLVEEFEMMDKLTASFQWFTRKARV